MLTKWGAGTRFFIFQVKNALSTAELIAKEIGVSRTTARRYLEHLVSEEKINADLSYGTVDRPEQIYIVKTYDESYLGYKNIIIISDNIIKWGAIGTLLVGFTYGFFTNWGFFKHRWVGVKFVLYIDSNNHRDICCWTNYL